MEGLSVAYCATSFGIFKITGDEKGIQAIQLTPKKSLPKQVVPSPLKKAVRQLTQYFNGRRKEFDLKLNFGDAPSFHQEVWKELITIPYGHTTSYSAIASTLGDANKMRAKRKTTRLLLWFRDETKIARIGKSDELCYPGFAVLTKTPKSSLPTLGGIEL